MLLTDFPREILLVIIDHLHLEDVNTLRSVSKSFNGFLELASNTIYRNAAIQRGYSDPAASLEDAKRRKLCSNWLESVDSWKSYCQSWVNLENNWQNHDEQSNPTFVYVSPGPGEEYHRVKFDEDESTLLTTKLHGDFGSVSSRCTLTGEVLWSLRPGGARPYAHLEYDNGFMVFDAYAKCHEVWIRSSILNAYTSTREPQPKQLIASKLAYTASSGWGNSTDEDGDELRQGRGVYVPYRVLRNPVPTRAYRFIFPELLVASQHLCTAHIWNVITGEITEAYFLIQGLITSPNPGPEHDPDEEGEELDGDDIRSINYVDFSLTHMFVCFGRKLVVYRRDPDYWRQRLLKKQNEDADSSASDCSTSPFPPPGSWPEAAHVLQLPNTSLQVTPFISIVGIDSTNRPILPFADISPATMISFTAVHVSPDGRDFVAISDDGLLYYVQDFACSAEVSHEPSEAVDAESQSSAQNDAGGPVIRKIITRSRMLNLVFDGNRIAFSTDEGLFLINLPKLRHAKTSWTDGFQFPAQGLEIHRVMKFEPHLSYVSCLQMSRTSLWISLGWTDIIPDVNVTDALRWPHITQVDYTTRNSTHETAPTLSTNLEGD